MLAGRLQPLADAFVAAGLAAFAARLLILTTGVGPGKHDHLAAGLFDLFLGRFAEAMGRDLELLRQLAVAQDLQHVEAALGEVLGRERLGRDFVAGLERFFEVADVDRRRRAAPSGC